MPVMHSTTAPGTHSPTVHPADQHDLTRGQGARVTNLKDASVVIPKRRLTVLTLVSGSSKSPLPVHHR